MRSAMLVVSMLVLSAPAWAAKGPVWKEEMDFYKSSKVAPLQTLALGSVDVRVGTHLERLTLLSGEGHTGKKVAGAAGAAALTMLGLGSGQDMAAREPLEEHLSQEDARRIADEVAQSIQQHLVIPGVQVVAGAAVTDTPAYQAAHGGMTGVDEQSLTVKDGRFSPEYHFGIWMQPAGGYAYRGPKGAASKFGFGGNGPMWGDKTFSPVVRAAVGAQALMTVDVFLANTRKDFRVQEMKVRLLGPMRDGGTDNIVISYLLDNPDMLAVPVEGSHKDSYASWQALRPAFEAKLQELSTLLASQVG